MRAVLPYAAGFAGVRVGEVDDAVPRDGEVLVAVRATALNRADLLQMRGRYPPPGGESEIPGLEAAGEIAALGEGVTEWQPGDRVTALLAGGGQAELVAVPAGQLIRIPEGWSFEEAAALPEAALTAWTNLVVEGRVSGGATVLVAGATSAVGSYTVQLARALGARVVAAGRDRERVVRLLDRGAEAAVTFDELPGALAPIAPEGVGLVIDFVGGEYLPSLLASLASRGRLVLVGLMAGARAELDLALVLRERLEIRGSVLRTRSRHEKAELVAGFLAFASEKLARRELMPVIDRVFELDRIADAYAHLERGRPFGKVVVRVSSSPPPT